MSRARPAHASFRVQAASRRRARLAWSRQRGLTVTRTLSEPRSEHTLRPPSMRTWLANHWENFRASLWFLPSVLVAACILLAVVTIRGDEHLVERSSEAIPYLFSGTADAARTMLSTIASSLLTVLSIAFSLTMVALQQASSQFSPRVLRSITSSRANQIVVGVYAGTFIYALLILRTIRGEHSPSPFVPALSVTSAVALALLCIAMLVYFIHHVSLSLQVSEVIKNLHDELIRQCERLFPEPLELDDEPRDDALAASSEQGERSPVRALVGGFVRRIDLGLADLKTEHPTTIWMTTKVGDFVSRGSIIASIVPASESLADRVRAAYILDSERSHVQDPLFDVRQLVDIGLRAMSPGVNDPTTAEYVLCQLGDALAVLASRQIHVRRCRAKPGHVRLYIDGPAWEDFVEAAFSQLRRASRADFDVTRCLLEVLAALAEQTTTHARASAIRAQVEEVRTSLAQQDFAVADRERLYALCEFALAPSWTGAVQDRAQQAKREQSEPC
jgi:uncharacterized membrane protein